MTYWEYILPALWTWAKGIRWLWTRELTRFSDGVLRFKRDVGVPVEQNCIVYKPGWGPWKFLPVYLTTYLAGVLAGYGCISLSRAWYERSQVTVNAGGTRVFQGATASVPVILGHGEVWAHPFARRMTRVLNWIFGGKHGLYTGPRLWGVGSVRTP